MKLAVNHYLVVLVAALAEAVRAAEACGIDLATFRDVLEAGPMASPVSRAKLDKLLRRDFSPQAAIHDVAAIAALVRDQARWGGVDVPLAETTARLFAEARDRGLAGLDMAAVFQKDGAPYAP
jgi:3-hydroxyisobutyrate dehydrogenase